MARFDFRPGETSDGWFRRKLRFEGEQASKAWLWLAAFRRGQGDLPGARMALLSARSVRISGLHLPRSEERRLTWLPGFFRRNA